ncbi:hypothetical protein BN3658_01849 [Coriobacteriaceae bacterium CHKCI002]|nr:hypothetical protein BN3658_01849 [Coriobacteriaceae bacterium CHKCI002]
MSHRSPRTNSKAPAEKPRGSASPAPPPAARASMRSLSSLMRTS